MQPQTPHNYSAAEIERYHNGSMTAAEMHALEKAALEDPFLADALDGYMHTQTPAADMAFLKEQLQHRSGKVIALPNFNRRLFLGIAAMLVLVAGFGWLAYQFSDSRNQNIAAQKQGALREEPALPQAADTTYTKPVEEQPVPPPSDAKEAQALSKKSAPKAPITDQTSSRAKTQAGTGEVTASTPTFSNPHTAAPLSKQANEMAASRVAENTFKARVVDAHNNAVPFATITNQQNKAIASTDSAGNFSVSMPDSSLTVAVNSAGYKQQQQTLVPADSSTRIVLQPATNVPDEVAVARKRKPTNTGSRVQLQYAEPIGGWKQFNTYVDSSIGQMKGPDALLEDREVVLSFDVDSSGNAINVQVVKSACSSCNATAIRVIQQGTKWKKEKRDNKANARIRF